VGIGISVVSIVEEKHISIDLVGWLEGAVTTT
jgi:hypothetical protein